MNFIKRVIVIVVLTLVLTTVITSGKSFAYHCNNCSDMYGDWSHNYYVGSNYITKGGFVTAVQIMLFAAGQQSTVGTVDGSFGPNTKQGVMNYQAGEGLGADGNVGPATWDNLQRYLIYATADSWIFDHPNSERWKAEYIEFQPWYAHQLDWNLRNGKGASVYK